MKILVDMNLGAVQEVLTTKAHRTCGSKAHEGNIDAKSNLYCPFVRLFRLRGKKFLLIGHLRSLDEMKSEKLAMRNAPGCNLSFLVHVRTVD